MVIIFLPYADFKRSLECLDDKRVGKQRVEASQIINTIIKMKSNPDMKMGWKNHPALQSWKDNLNALVDYYNKSLEEFASRGFKNIKLQPMEIKGDIVYPWWLGYSQIHLSHQASLIRKKPDYYIKLFKKNFCDSATIPHLTLGYIWPCQLTSSQKKKIITYLESDKVSKKDPFLPYYLCCSVKYEKRSEEIWYKFPYKKTFLTISNHAVSVYCAD